MVSFFRTRSLHREAQAPPELKRAHPAERALYPLGVVALDVGVYPGRELLQGDARPVPAVEHLRLHRPEEAPVLELSGEHPLRDIGPVTPASSHMAIHPGQR